MSAQEIDKALTSGFHNEIRMALLSLAYHHSDFREVQRRSLEFVDHPDPNVRAVAVRCHDLVLVFHKTADADLLREVFLLTRDENAKEVLGELEDLRDQIMSFHPELRSTME